ncbi:MAG: hypothetical protein WAL25_09945 [Acidimicrobiia bacterium]
MTLVLGSWVGLPNHARGTFVSVLLGRQPSRWEDNSSIGTRRSGVMIDGGIEMSTRTDNRPVAAAARLDRAQVRPKWFAVGLALFGFGAAMVAVLGPLVTELIEYHASEGAVNQIIGGDVAGLLLVAPVSILAGLLVWRGHSAGPVLALGPAVYGLYMYSQLALGNDISRYEGNSERFFPLYLGLFVLAAAIAIAAWTAIDISRLPQTSKRLNRSFGWFVLVIAVFLAAGLHLPGLVDAWADQPVSPDYLADPVVFWLVKFMDLALVVPALVAVGVGVLRNAAWAEKAKFAAVGWVALLASSVAGMAIVMQVTGDPAGTVANTIAFSTFAALGLVVAVLVYRLLFIARRSEGMESA